MAAMQTMNQHHPLRSLQVRSVETCCCLLHLAPPLEYTDCIHGIFITQMRNSLLHGQGPLLASHAAAAAAAARGLFNQPLFNAAALGMNKFGSSGEIDLSLPITSTYLRRMRALGLAMDPAGVYQLVSVLSVPAKVCSRRQNKPGQPVQARAEGRLRLQSPLGRCSVICQSEN